MRNQIKADFYKLTHSFLFKVIIGINVILFCMLVAMSRSSDGFYMGFAREYVGKNPIVDGFVAFAFDDPAHPAFWEVVYSAVSMTFFLWLVLLVLTVLNFSKDFTNGTIRLSFANGKNRYVLFLSKFTVIAVFFGVMYYAFNVFGYIVAAYSCNYGVSADGFKRVLQLTTLLFLILCIFALMSMVLYCFTQNAAVVITVMIALMYSTFFIILCLRDQQPPAVVRVYFYINPMYYLWKASGYWAHAEIVKEILIYFIVAFPTLNFIGYYLMENKEIK